MNSSTKIRMTDIIVVEEEKGNCSNKALIGQELRNKNHFFQNIYADMQIFTIIYFNNNSKKQNKTKTRKHNIR